MKVLFDLFDAYQEAGLTTEEDVEDMKSREDIFQVVHISFYFIIRVWYFFFLFFQNHEMGGIGGIHKI